MADVFLSYKREDAASVRKLVTALRERGLEVWWDEDIPPSAPWEATIEKALIDAKTVVVCWSPASVASENVRSEARVAREDGRLIQVFVKPSAPPLFFGERQGVDLSKWRGNADDPRIGTLTESIRKLSATHGVAIDTVSTGAPLTPFEKTRRPSRLVAMATIMLLVLGAGSLIAYRIAMARPLPQVAVLPFEDMSSTHDKGYFAEGVAEEILSALSTDKDIRVLGRTSARQIKRDADPKAVRRLLGVTHLLEGSARTAGDQLRVNVRLIDTATGTSLWDEEYHGRLADVFAVQDQIASTVVNRLRGTFSRRVKLAERQATQVSVYQTYLAARALARNRTAPTLRQALGLAQQVVRTDPNYAPGHALLAELYVLLSDDPLAYGSIPSVTAGRLAKAHARTAIRLAPNRADGYAALALPDLSEASIAPLRRAIQLDPSRADVRIWLSFRLSNLGRDDEALQLARDAVQIEPLWPVPLATLVRLLSNGREAEARRAAADYLRRTGNEAQYRRMLFLMLLKGPDISGAVAEGERARALDPTLPDLLTNLRREYHSVGLDERAPAEVDPAAAPYTMAFYKGDYRAFEKLMRASAPRMWQVPDHEVAFFYLASIHDWPTLNRLFDTRPIPAGQLCMRDVTTVQALVPALRVAGRQEEAVQLMECLRARVATLREEPSALAYVGDYEFDQATVSALSGNREKALEWLKRAVVGGWLGRPYSPKLADRPQFDSLRLDPRFAALQSRIDGRLAQERREILSGQHRTTS